MDILIVVIVSMDEMVSQQQQDYVRNKKSCFILVIIFKIRKLHKQV